MEGSREGSGAGGPAHGRPGVAARNVLRVLTLNIWNRHDPWEARLGLIRKGVRELAPDVVGLQEVMWYEGRSLADSIAEGLGYEVAFGAAHDLGGGVLFGNAVLSRWPVARSQAFPLPTGETDEKRSILFAELASPHGVLPFFVTHLNWKFHHGAVREAQVAAVAEIVMREAPMEGPPPVVVGDFNAQPEATEIRFMKGLHALNQKSVYFADTFDQTGKGPGFTFDPVRNPFAAVTNEYPRRIDYIFVRGPDKQGRGKPLSSRVVFEEVEDGVAASDHYGVLSEISV
ncbi:endonuclease/exonuclease/phosphatase family protein [Sorangium sp. So ce1097]|uniref:endonuclease/exonuclease/phosphatase family protein n=1 Tax=Sorangium sp. So ce1097 TaxID=3133330 RepID=UPI003F5D6246